MRLEGEGGFVTDLSESFGTTMEDSRRQSMALDLDAENALEVPRCGVSQIGSKRLLWRTSAEAVCRQREGREDSILAKVGTLE